MDIRKFSAVMALAAFVAIAPAALAKDKGWKQEKHKEIRTARIEKTHSRTVMIRGDLNGDGFVDRREWVGDSALFTRLDTNRDGVLTRSEQQTARVSRHQRARPAKLQKRFNGMDRNRDGRVTRDEWRGNDRSFRQHDRNGDGVISWTDHSGR